MRLELTLPFLHYRLLVFLEDMFKAEATARGQRSRDSVSSITAPKKCDTNF